MILIDEKFKDAAPEQTVEKILKILKDNDIVVEEHWGETGVINCYSLSIQIVGTTVTSNGKGVTPALARASAYAELMERVQSGNRGRGKTIYSDSEVFSATQLIENCGETLDAIAKAHPDADGNVLSTKEMAELVILLDNGENATVLPFYNVTDGCMTYFPIAATNLFTSTGLAAGNSPEEALVQGLSEIIERHVLIRIMNKGIVPPEIPEEVLKQYPETYATIAAIREAGYDIMIKDCSLDQPFPVLAALLIDKKTHRYHVHMGCHPVFEIALRRTLTETFQGRTIKNVTSIAELTPHKGYKNSELNITQNIARYGGTHPTDFFGKNYSYEFKPFKDRSGMSNKEILAEIHEFVSSKGYKMLIRDHSCLGFNTYRIIIPGFYERDHFFTPSSKNYRSMTHFYNAMRMTPVKDITKDLAAIKVQLDRYWMTLMTRPQFTKRFCAPLNIDKATDQALFMLNVAHYEWIAGNHANTIMYLQRAIQNAPDYDSDYLHCLYNWIRFEGFGCTKDEIITNLAIFYSEETMQEVTNAIESGKPFAKYAHCCDDINCADCKYKRICLEEASKALKAKVNNALAVFDNAAAFERLKKLFSEIL